MLALYHIYFLNQDASCKPDSVRDPSVHPVSPSKAKDKDGKSRSSSRDLSYGNQKVEGDVTDLCNVSFYIKNCALSHPYFIFFLLALY